MNPRQLTCEEVIEQLFDYLDHELDDRQAADMERHLDRCRDCFTRSEFEKRLRARVEATGRVKAPLRLHRRIGRLLERFDNNDALP